MTTSTLPVIDKQEYDAFAEMYRTHKKYRGQRYGQAFYNRFSLHEVEDQSLLEEIYSKSGDEALRLIKKLFNL